MFFSRRARAGPDRFLPLKTGALIAGIALGLAGMRFGSSWLIGVAIVVVLAGFLLRFARDPASRDQNPEDAGETPQPRTPGSGPAKPR